MDTQTEIKKVISVDLGNTATSLKDYKKHIDDLRGSLLQLDETSEEYKKISQEIKNEQDKLNEVMKAGKYDVDQAEGSYNQLTKTMSELKKEWKATGDEARRAELGQQILDINNQLKELDQSTGDFHRSVGDYANAFEQAFDKCLDGVKNLDGPIGDLGGTVKNLLPVIKSVNQTAVAGLSGVKKALASTGIGLIIVAVGELVSHWQDLLNIVGVSQEDMQEFKEKAVNALKNVVSGAVGVGNAIGNFLLAPIRATIEAFKGLGSIIKDVFTGNFDKVKEDAAAAFDAIKSIGQKAIDFRGNYEQGREIADNMIATIEERMKSSKKTEEAGAKAGENIASGIAKGVKDGMRSEASNIQKTIDDFLSGAFKTLLNYNIEELKEEAKRRAGWLKDAMQEAVDEANQAQFDLKYGDRILTAQEEADAEYEIERNLIEKKIALQKTFLANFIGTAEEREKYEKDLAKSEQDLQNLDVKHTKKTEEQKKKDRQLAVRASLDTAASVFGSLSDLMEEGSAEQKVLSIMETTISTLTGAIDAYKSMAGIPYVGPALGAAAAAAVTATGIATIAKIKSTTKESAGSASVSAPQASVPTMTSVNPLLNEQDDLNRLEAYGQNTQAQQNIRCYVVEQDISEAQNKVQVVEDNVTF